MRSSGTEHSGKTGKVPTDRETAMLPPIINRLPASPITSDDGSDNFVPFIGVAGYKDLHKVATRSSSPPSRRSSMLSSTRDSPTKLPTLEGSTRGSVASMGSSRSVKPSARSSMCRSPSCPQLYGEFVDDPFPEVAGGDLNASIHPRHTRKSTGQQTTTLRLPEIFNAAETTPKFKRQANGVKNTHWLKATPRGSQPNSLSISSYMERQEGASLKRQTTSSVGSSLGSSPTKSDMESSQYCATANALLLPLRDTKRTRKKRRRSKKLENGLPNAINAGKGSSPRKENGANVNASSIGKWDTNGADYEAGESSNSVDSDCDLTYDQDLAIDEIAMENKVTFGCMKSL